MPLRSGAGPALSNRGPVKQGRLSRPAGALASQTGDPMTASTIEGRTPAASPEVFGHPRGLIVLAGTELWDRISFHGMQALLVLYMVDALLLPGHAEHVVGLAGFRAFVEHWVGPLSVQALAAQTFGIYVGLIY